MKHLRIILPLIVLGISAALGASPFEQELSQLQEQRTKALAAVSDPVNRRYAASLQQLLRRATQSNDLEAALKVKAALADIAPLVPPSAEATSQTARLSIQAFARQTLSLQHGNWLGWLRPIKTEQDRANATFERVTGVAGKKYVSFRSPFSPELYLGHGDFRVKLMPLQDNEASRKNRSFKQQRGLAHQTRVSFESVDYPGYFMRAEGDELHIQKNDSTSAFREDATFLIAEPQSRK